MQLGAAKLSKGAFGALVVASVFGILSASAATAKTVTVGQLFTPKTSCYASYTGLVTGVASGTSYVVPKAGVITSWSFHDGATPVAAVKLKVGRGAGSGKYTIVGSAKAGAQTANSVNTYKAHIAVKAGDLLGYTPPTAAGSAERKMPTAWIHTCTRPVPMWRRARPRLSTPALAGRSRSRRVSAKNCVVPNLKGKTLKAAKKALAAANCTLGKVRPKGQTKGKVKSQNPTAGKSWPQGPK